MTLLGTTKGLTVICADERIHANTCDYWYLVKDRGTAHTAFNRRESLTQWLKDRGLSLDGELSEHGTFKVVHVIGNYRNVMHWSYDQFFGMANPHNIVTRALSNGQYTMAIITTDTDGMRTVHTMNPNCKYRPVYDYWESRAMLG